ncbi:MAG TPA: amidase [Bradyrhizobium sp.]|uniref:amidase n=1 Tax=Bradyrhizobium sp. TaxID=376 RepID=UPI002CB45244|nr:amidase [Bradyrhizobium sp.]HLZ06745.1 amidase [Bradyrhizobium sp.]
MISLADLKRRIDKGELSPEAALAQSLEVIAAQEKTIGAFAHLAPHPRAQQQGPLRGIAVGIKDIVDTSDMPTQMGAEIYKGHRPRADAPVVMLLKEAGATVAGKTTTTAFAANDPTATLNPHNHAHTPGGSSSGSAAAVAAGMLPLALGTQTGGSVIRPASFCGVAAIKPSYRMLPTVGVKCFSWTLDTVGVFAAGVEDVAVALSAMTSRPELLAPAAKAPKIGVVTQDFAGPAEKAGTDALKIAAAAAEKAGASVRELKMPTLIADAWRIHTTVQQFEAHQAFAWEYRENYDAMPPLLRKRLDESRDIQPADYDEARSVARKARVVLCEIFRDVDVILALSAPGAAPKGLDWTGDPRFNRLWTLMGTPCVNVPAHVAEGNLPIGVQVIADFGDDAKALAVARFLEAALRA